MSFTTASGFYAGIFYPANSPLYDPSGGELIYGGCFAAAGQGTAYRGFLFQTTELRADYYLYA